MVQVQPRLEFTSPRHTVETRFAPVLFLSQLHAWSDRLRSEMLLAAVADDQVPKGESI